MATTTFDYAVGYTNSEHDRLIRQAARIAPYTERLFRANISRFSRGTIGFWVFLAQGSRTIKCQYLCQMGSG
jgi:hypothetical protein